jgi:hypothetical protein
MSRLDPKQLSQLFETAGYKVLKVVDLGVGLGNGNTSEARVRLDFEAKPAVQPNSRWTIHERDDRKKTVIVHGVYENKTDAVTALRQFADRLFPSKLKSWVRWSVIKGRETFNIPQIKTTFSVSPIVEVDKPILEPSTSV